jgi:hypothetical protein
VERGGRGYVQQGARACYFRVDVQFRITRYGGIVAPAPSGTGSKKRCPSLETSKNTSVEGSLNKGCGGPLTLKVGSVLTGTAMSVPSLDT